mgnify:CR=1 FL=1
MISVAIAIAYDSFFREKSQLINTKQVIQTDLSKYAEFSLKLSIEFPFLYGAFAILLAIGLGALTAGLRKIVSDFRKNLGVKGGLRDIPCVSPLLNYIARNPKEYTNKRVRLPSAGVDAACSNTFPLSLRLFSLTGRRRSSRSRTGRSSGRRWYMLDAEETAVQS